MGRTFDLAIVGGGVIGMAHAILAAEAGLSVALFETRGRAVGASIRNFGLVTVTGQKRGPVWSMSLRSRDVWAGVAGRAGVAVLQKGMGVVAQTPEAEAVLDAFLETEMGAECFRLSAGEAADRIPLLRSERLVGALWSPHELRVEPRLTLPALARYLSGFAHASVRFGAPAARIEPGAVVTLAGERVAAKQVIVCTGADARSMFPELLASAGAKLTKLHMLRVVPRAGAGDLAAPAVSDLTLVRYRGFSDLPEARALAVRLGREAPEMLSDGVHVIAVRSADGSLVVGDSHHDCEGEADDPFQPEATDGRILAAAGDFLDLEGARITERWTGAYVTAPETDWIVEEVAPGVTLALVIGGKGMTLSFGFAEQVLNKVLGLGPVAALEKR